MASDIKDVLLKHTPHLVYDKKLYTKLQMFRIGWMQKSDDYMEFLGGNLLGVQPIRFSTRDEDMLIVDILGIDIKRLGSDINDLDGIDPSWKTTSNPVYLTLGYLMHKFMTSKEIGQYRDNAIKELYYIFAYKVIGSLISHGFKYTADINLATATYEKLSNRFILKKTGSWQALFEYRSNDIILHNGLHYNNILKYTTATAVASISDLQGRIREAFKNIYSVMVELKDKGNIMTTTNLMELIEDEVSLKDVTERPDKYSTYMYSILNSNDFVKDELIHLLESVLPNMKPDVLKDTLKYISAKKIIARGDATDILDPIITISIKYLSDNKIKNSYQDQVMDILKLLKNYWSSSKTNDAYIKKLKVLIGNDMYAATKKKTAWLRTTTVLGVLLYVFLRSISKDIYK